MKRGVNKKLRMKFGTTVALFIAAFGIALFLIFYSFPSVDSVGVSSCQSVNASGFYTLDNDVISNDTCFEIFNLHNVTIDCGGLQIGYNANNGSYDYGIHVANSTNVLVQNCFIEDFGLNSSLESGFRIENSSKVFVESSSVYSKGTHFVHGVVSLDSSNLHVSGSNFTVNSTLNNNWGFFAQGTDNITFTNNSLSIQGEHFTLASRVLDAHNVSFYDNEFFIKGFNLSSHGGLQFASIGDLVFENNFLNSTVNLISYGVLSSNLVNPRFYNNEFYTSGNGASKIIFAFEWENSFFGDNLLVASRQDMGGIYLLNSDSNVFKNNVFLGLDDAYLDVGESSNLNLVDQLDFLSKHNFDGVFGLSLIEEDFGKILFNQTITHSGSNLSDFVILNDNFVSINSSAVPSFNISAEITLYNLTNYTSPFVEVDWNDNSSFEECFNCSVLIYDANDSWGNFLVPHFTSYRIYEAASQDLNSTNQTEPVNDTVDDDPSSGSSSGGGGGASTRYVACSTWTNWDVCTENSQSRTCLRRFTTTSSQGVRVSEFNEVETQSCSNYFACLEWSNWGECESGSRDRVCLRQINTGPNSGIHENLFESTEYQDCLPPQAVVSVEDTKGFFDYLWLWLLLLILLIVSGYVAYNYYKKKLKK